MGASSRPSARVWGQKLGQPEEAHENEQTEVFVTKRFRKVVLGAAIACALAFAAALSGCSASQAYTPETKTAQVQAPAIKEDGVLHVGVNTDRSPLAGMSKDKIVGIDVDIAAAVADNLGLKLSIVDVGSDPESALKNGDVDMVLGIDKNGSDGSFWKSDSYLSTGVALFAMSKNAAVPTAQTGAKFAAQVSSTSAWAVMNEFGDSSLTSTSNLKDAFSALSSGSVQYVAADAVIGMFYANGSKIDANIVALMQQPSGYCAGVLDSNSTLKTAVADALSNLTSKGVIDVIQTKWLGSTVDLSSVPLTAGATSQTSKSSGTSAAAATAATTDASGSDSSSSTGGTSTAGSNAVKAS